MRRYNADDVAEIARTYGEISVFMSLIDEGINPVDNAEKCLIAIQNYERIPKEIKDALGLNVSALEKKCREELAGYRK